MNKIFSRQPKWKTLAIQLGVITTTLLGSFSNFMLPVLAAESVIVRKGFISFSVPVKDIKQFVDTQKPPLSLLGIYSLLSAEQKQQVLNAFNTQLKLSQETVKTVVNSEIGNEILDNFYSVMVSAKKQENNALKQAILTAAEDPKGLSILGFLEAYPRQTIDVDINQAFSG